MLYRAKFESAKFDWGHDAFNKIDKLNEEELVILDEFLGYYFFGEMPYAQEIDDFVSIELRCIRNSYDTVCGYDTIFFDTVGSYMDYFEQHSDEFAYGYVEIVF